MSNIAKSWTLGLFNVFLSLAEMAFKIEKTCITYEFLCYR